MLPPGPPLHPSGEEGRRLLRDELVKSEYHDRQLVQRFLDWLSRLFDRSVGAASGVGWTRALATMVIAVGLLLALAGLLARLRRERRQRPTATAVLPAERPSASLLRRRAEEALAQGRHDDALVDGFRALTARAIERGALDDLPGATAHEVAVRLGTAYPEHDRPVARGADLFDATLYGDRPASRDEAAGMLGLDDRLAGVR
jgi:hypothetical protein